MPKTNVMMTAQRFAGKPLAQPKYSMRDVPSCAKNLEGSILLEITERDYFNDSMAEMVLLCNEVMRRKATSDPSVINGKKKAGGKSKMKRPSKPLSLEYMADRLDVDDPIFGFVLRTNIPPSEREKHVSRDQLSRFQKGMMQGFITVTTFTNWQESFRWDSMHESATSYDEKDLCSMMRHGERQYDLNGTLSAELQNTVRCGDPWNEGIVFPRLAEISLLGGLGCGKALLSLAIERLETMPSSGKRNYDYAVLQATKNSISFYESMGFVRVGAITEDPAFDVQNTEREKEMDPCAKKAEGNKIVSTPCMTIKTTKAGQTPAEYAKRFFVDVWDIIYLNQFLYPDIMPKSYLMEGTELFIPNRSKLNGISNALANKQASIKSSATQWYYAENDETPRAIANKFNVKCRDLLECNRRRISDLQGLSRLIEGTKIQVSNLTTHHDKHVPYCHWTFPDDTLENNEPSYMMARKLNRRTGAKAKHRPVELSFATVVKKAETRDRMNIPVTHQKSPLISCTSQALKKSAKKSKKRKRHPEEPMKPKRPRPAFFFFVEKEREIIKLRNEKIAMTEITKSAARKWREMSTSEKASYEEDSERSKLKHQEAMNIYESEMNAFKAAHPDWKEEDYIESMPKISKMMGLSAKTPNLFNKVVMLNSDGKKEAGTEFEYYYVLTYIPDLFWCHLAPMRKVGVFGPKKKKAEGRPIWMLVGEEEGKEIDITANVCEIVKSRGMRGMDDADKEQWDILDSPSIQEKRSSKKSLKLAGAYFKGSSEKAVTPESDEVISEKKRNDKERKGKVQRSLHDYL